MATQCQVILTLAHLLQQNSLSYDDEKNILLNTSVKCATEMANQGNTGTTSDDDGDVHMVLTGSPRPTFAETNAWLLEGQATAAAAEQQRKASADAASGGGEGVVGVGVGAAISKKSGESFRGSYSIADNNVEVVTEAEADAIVAEEEAEEGEGGGGGAQLLQEYIAECTHNSSTKNANMDDLGGSPGRIGGSVLNRFSERKYSHGDAGAGGVGSEERGNSASGDDDAVRVGEFDSGNSEKNLDDTAQKSDNNNNNTIESSNGKEESADDEIDNSQHSKGPMVGHAVVNAVSQQQGVGLQSSRAQLLQGTIDRPLWDQRRWTDGECLFSELVERCGLESFENVGVAGSHVGKNATSGGADAAAGGKPSAGTAAGQLQKTTNLLAHLITVPAMRITENDDDDGDEMPGLAEDVVDEIARGILRCLKRKKSPPASKVYLVLPPKNGARGDDKEEEEWRELVRTRLAATWNKLEKYNDMIGLPKLMADAELIFVDGI